MLPGARLAVKNVAIMSELLIMAYLKNAAVIRHCKASKVKNRLSFYPTGLFGTRPYLGALARYLAGHRGSVPFHFVSLGHPTYRMVLIVHTRRFSGSQI